MALIKEVVSLIILMVISKFFVSCGRIHQSDYERLDYERRSGTTNDQRNIAAPTAWADPNYTPDYNPYGAPQIQQYPQYPQYPDSLPPIQTTTTTTTTTTTDVPEVINRNSFGDLPVKCGPNQEKIRGVCRDV